MSVHPLVVFHNNDRGISLAEQSALASYVDEGGILLVTGHDSLGSPTDTLLASVLGLSTEGDEPFATDVVVTDGTHPVFSGDYGAFATGSVWTASGSDHDGARVMGGTQMLMSIAGSYVKLSYAQIGSEGGVAMYWNGNQSLTEWTRIGTSRNIFLNLMDSQCGSYFEACDEGGDNSDTAPGACRTDCSEPYCGDGVVDTPDGEECDDGNATDGDGCSSICELPP